jgi:hypothetical protein
VGRVVVGTLVAEIGVDTQPVPFGEAVGQGTGLADIGPAPDKVALGTVLGFVVDEGLVSGRTVLAGTGAEAGREYDSDHIEADGDCHVGSDIHERIALEPEAGRRLEGCRPSPVAFRWLEPLLQQWPL